ncbi:hypothetical protein ACOSP6_10415 [Tenacibaculum sp. MEBiC06402]|uniref:hypothetical protein n=1 Tax=unclassified Tenacibaculum TaxID=2635139 RepID=UPI003B9B3532
MKSIKLFLVFALLIFSTSISANTNPTEDKLKMTVISKEISKLLANPNFPVLENASVIVKFTVNKKNEIVVLSVEAENNENIIEEYIKERLNYRRLSRNMTSKVYTLPVKMISL